MRSYRSGGVFALVMEDGERLEVPENRPWKWQPPYEEYRKGIAIAQPRSGLIKAVERLTEVNRGENKTADDEASLIEAVANLKASNYYYGIHRMALVNHGRNQYPNTVGGHSHDPMIPRLRHPPY